MRIRGCTSVLSGEEQERIHAQAVRILAEIGARVESEELVAALRAQGAVVDGRTGRVLVPEAAVARFIEESETVADMETGVAPGRGLHPLALKRARVNCAVGGYALHYLPPGEAAPHLITIPEVEKFTRLADGLEAVDAVGFVGFPSDVPKKTATLHVCRAMWKNLERNQASSSLGNLLDGDLLPYRLEMAEIMVAAKGGEVNGYFNAGVFMVPPLKVPRVEAELFLRCQALGLNSGFSHMHTIGGSAPVTVAGTASLLLAHTFLTLIINRAYYGGRYFEIGASVGLMDMKNCIFAPSRPEVALTYLALADMARELYRVPFNGYTSLMCTAAYPGETAGMEKLMVALPNVLAGSGVLAGMGSLSLDEIISPVQLMLDCDLVGALQRLARGFEVTEEALAFETIRETVLRDGVFTAAEHTARHFRQEQWIPDLWAREMYHTWQAHGGRKDVEIAEERARGILASHFPRGISEETERELGKVIARAEAALGK